MEASYSPVQWEYRELIEEQIAKEGSGKVFYFSSGEICEVEGRLVKMQEEPEGIFIHMGTGEHVRIDRIITLFGKPGPAYDEYDAFANACMDCNGGYSQEEIDEFNNELGKKSGL